MDKMPEKSSEVKAEVRPATKVRGKLGWMRYFSAQAQEFCQTQEKQDAPGKTRPIDGNPEEEVLRRYRAIIIRAKRQGDLGAEIRAVDKLCKVQGIGASESVKNLERIPMDKLIRQLDAGIRLLGPFMIDVLDARVFQPGVEAIWDHKVSREEAPQYMVECLRLAPFLRTKNGAPNRTRAHNRPGPMALAAYRERKKAEKAAKNAAEGVQITVR